MIYLSNLSSLESLAVIGLNHHSAPLHVRERVVVNKDQAIEIMGQLQEFAKLEELCILSTCNRTEIYFCGDAEAVKLWFVRYSGLDALLIDSHLYVYTQSKAIHHLFRVVCALDSMVLGETQIAGQAKQAWSAAKENGFVKDTLSAIFQAALATAKSVRAETTIGLAPVSMPSVALHLAEEVFQDSEGVRVLLIGSGEMVDHAALYFSQERGYSLTFCNRTLSKAITLAQQYQGRAVGLDHLSDVLSHHDVLICSTLSQTTIIEFDAMRQVIEGRGDKPLLVIDLSVPRDVDARVADLPKVHYYCVDDLGDIIAKNQNIRKEALDAANAIVNRHLDQYLKLQVVRQQIPDLLLWRQEVELYLQEELSRARHRLQQGEMAQEVLDQFGRRLTNKFLHAPSHLMSHGSDDDRRMLAHFFQKMIESSRS
jgi:glutamyl-tRNA reductase